MGMFILGNIHRIKNMAKGLSFGLVYVKIQLPKMDIRKWNNIRVHGGVGCLMVKVSMKNIMV